MNTPNDNPADDAPEADSDPGLTEKQKRDIQAADIRNGRIDPANTEHLWISGWDEWGSTDEEGWER
jgi:hypothetical protein